MVLPQAGPDHHSVAVAAQSGTTKAQYKRYTRHREHTDLVHQIGDLGDLEHWELEQVVHSAAVQMIAGYSADNDHCTDHHDDLLLMDDSSPPIMS